jgi:hypothetical protein
LGCHLCQHVRRSRWGVDGIVPYTLGRVLDEGVTVVTWLSDAEPQWPAYIGFPVDEAAGLSAPHTRNFI